MILTTLQECLYETVKAAAQAGEFCPTNRVLAERSGLVSASTVADALGRLQRKGLIEVRHRHARRVIQLPGLELGTAEPPPPPDKEDLASLRAPLLAARRASERERLFPAPKPWRKNPRFLHWRPATCQYIAGEPSTDDRIKCGAPVVPARAYCAEHLSLCVTVRPGRRETGKRSAGMILPRLGALR